MTIESSPETEFENEPVRVAFLNEPEPNGEIVISATQDFFYEEEDLVVIRGLDADTLKLFFSELACWAAQAVLDTGEAGWVTPDTVIVAASEEFGVFAFAPNFNASGELHGVLEIE